MIDSTYLRPFASSTELEETGKPLSNESKGDVFDSVNLKPCKIVGEKFLSNGDVYVGSLLGNVPDGFGKYLWSDGCMYEGDWEKGKKHGKGKISWPSGATYEGDFVDGHVNGMGAFTAFDNSVYKGDWFKNEKKGFGTKSYANGDVYEGSWDQGLPDGSGRYVWKNGNEYVGDWKNGAMCGKGLLRWACGDQYDGEWFQGLEHGHGTYTWADGSCYVGTWTKGLKDGKGTLMPPRRSHSYGYASDLDVNKGATFEDLSSPRQNHYVSDSEQCIEGVHRASNHDSINGQLTYGEVSTSSEFGSTNSSSLGRRWDDHSTMEYDLEMKSNREDSNAIIDRYRLMEEATYVSLIVEREYVQGVLINEIAKKNPTLREAKPLRRWHRRKSREPMKPGEAIFKGHQSYDLMVNLQLGIRYSVGKITPLPVRELSPADFGPRARIGVNFPREGSQITPSHESVDFKWKDYCPMVFRHLRELFEIDSADYMLSICGDSALRELSSPGKSGSVFYLSNDDRFMIKTMRTAEVKALLGMLQNYYNHVRMYDNTLVTKFFGLHRIKPAGGPKVHFVVMGNVFCTELPIHRKFDLKGSSQGRSADKIKMDENTTLKDLDLDFIFHLDPSWQLALLRQIDLDCKFLEHERIMDYSLLLGIHFRAPQFSAVFSSHPSQQQTLCDGGQKFYDSDTSNALYLVAHEPQKNTALASPHIRGSPLKTAAGGDKEVDLLLPGTARLRIQLGVNMPARADRRLVAGSDLDLSRGQLEESFDVVLYCGIIDILQQYDIVKKLEHAYKSLHFDAYTISAVDPSVYASRFQDFMSHVFPEHLG
ncbi:hypothetical protein KP509_26G065500 [Ceratopteris richardii]|uniref:Phosphatidylinositol 4-phosphate 5-kinase n=1 Tax=Ceratopteris richardii TaxID=49495 RepID=A0A8T2RLT8_CERRI|nr:hypothetical protein KP509_26G065500 [Ceratopteris richardii]KAH7297320.1 hypothetical protein KP509_26G065500 [Ceratopteris richardii]KAH7297322.1 hypothetical protein KP509_26G065500 [Ceratopteris richardii]KAH7297324.1 hypothetical protein KP509_26G065500 [Ceratopteris richardii]KAH7297326.1 hypothetical protein KP509_26G065500 [Ceratopteris richardii]